jgi:hypothetical protein
MAVNTMQSTGAMLAMQRAKDQADVRKQILNAAPIQNLNSTGGASNAYSLFSKGADSLAQTGMDILNRPTEQLKLEKAKIDNDAKQIDADNLTEFNQGFSALVPQLGDLSGDQAKTQLFELMQKTNQGTDIQPHYEKLMKQKEFYGSLNDDKKKLYSSAEQEVSNVIQKEQSDYLNFKGQKLREAGIDESVNAMVDNDAHQGDKEFDDYIDSKTEGFNFGVAPIFKAFNKYGVANPNKAMVAAAINRGQTDNGWLTTGDKGKFVGVDAIVQNIVGKINTHQKAISDLKPFFDQYEKDLETRAKGYQQQLADANKTMRANSIRQTIGGQSDLPNYEWEGITGFDPENYTYTPKKKEEEVGGSGGGNGKGGKKDAVYTLLEDTDLTSTIPEKGTPPSLLPSGEDVANFSHNLFEKGTFKSISQVKEEQYTQEYIDQFRNDPRFNPAGGPFNWDDANASAKKMAKARLLQESLAAEKVVSDIPNSYTTTNLSQEADPLNPSVNVKQPAQAKPDELTSTLNKKQPNLWATAPEKFKGVISKRESSDNYTAEQGSYMGKYQLGPMALQDLGYKDKNGKWTGKNGIKNKKDFLNNKDVQEKAANSWFNALDKRMKSEKLEQYVGTTFQGIPVTREGMMAAAHLIGARGLAKMFKTGKIPEDGLGTKATEYLQLFKG